MTDSGNDPGPDSNDPPPAQSVSGAPEAPAVPADNLTASDDRLLRALADAENARRRAERSYHDGREAGIAEVIKGIIPALDSLDLAIATATSSSEKGHSFLSLIEGLTGTHRAFEHALEKFGVELIQPAEGDQFDPHIHEAVSIAQEGSLDSGKVNRSVQTGYRMGSKLLRPARVIINA